MKSRSGWVRAGAFLTVFAAVVGGGCSSSGGGSGTKSNTPPAALSGQGNVGSAGGSVATPDGAVQVTVPPGALASDLTITITPTTSSVPGAVGQVWEIGPTGTQFAAPVTIALRFTVDELAAADPSASPSSFPVSTVVDGQWAPVSAAVVNAEAHTIAGQTMHLSPYALSELKSGTSADAGIDASVTNDAGDGGDAGTSKNDPKCPSAPPVVDSPGNACSDAGLVCTYTDNGTYFYAYCDGKKFEVLRRGSVCPSTEPSGSCDTNTYNGAECDYLAAAPDHFDGCECYLGTWKCGNNYACVTTASVGLSTDTGTLPASGIRDGSPCATSAAGATCAYSCPYGGGTCTVTYTCTANAWTTAYTPTDCDCPVQ